MSARWERLEAKYSDKELVLYKTKEGQPHFFNPPEQWSIPLEKSTFRKVKGSATLLNAETEV